MDAGLAELAAQGDASLTTLFRAFHAASQRTHLRDEFGRYGAAEFAGNFAAVKRDAKVGAASTAVQAGI
jgi:hypothetical protein